MVRKIFFCLLFLPLPMALGQGLFVGPYTSFKVVNGVTLPNANATVTVCAAGVGGIPCSPALVNAVYSNLALTIALSNPFTSDANGNYSFAIAPGNYTVTETALGFAGKSFQVSVGGGALLGPIRGLSFTVYNSAGLAAGTTSASYDIITVPFSCSLQAYNLAIDQGTITVKFWKVATGTAIPTSGNSISTSGESIASGTAIHSTTLTDFTTTTVSQNDIMAMDITAVAGGATFVNGVLACQ